MPVVLKNSKKEGFLQCDSCKKLSPTYKATSPAAPELTICEQAYKEHGWAYNIGFQAMLMGHTVYCPACAKGEENAKQ